MGFGTNPIKDPQVFLSAMEVGYRHFDTAGCYENEEFLGEAIATCGLKREELWITTKIWHTDYSDPEAALRTSLAKLQTDHVDVYLVHWPHMGQEGVPMHVLWQKMEALVDLGLTKAIGVSNFNLQLLADITTYAKHKPVCNQIQLYPECAQDEFVQWMLSKNILPVAYSPVARGGSEREH